MFYVYEKIYVGAEKESVHDEDVIEVRSQPPVPEDDIDYFSYEWTCLGRYDSHKGAQTAVHEFYSEVRSKCVNGNPFETSDADVLNTYKPGKFAPLGDGAGAWLFEDLVADITVETTDDQLAELLVRYESNANEEGYTIGVGGLSILEGYRDGLLDALESAAR
jgi:hypothetical protein